MVTTITITQRGKKRPSYTYAEERRITEEEVHKIVTEDGMIGLDPEKCDVQIFYDLTKNKI